MAISSNTGYRQSGSSFRSYVERLPELSRHDVVLAAMPLIFALALSGHALLSVPLYIAIGVGALLSNLLLVDAIYLNPPGSHSDGTTR